MSANMGDIREAIADLNIQVPEERTPSTSRNDLILYPEWKDITKFLDEATADMEVGQLVHLHSFTLFDAMSAIEIMDPKMDTGMVTTDSYRRLLTIDGPLKPAQLLWVMDRLLNCEMAWISGHSLSQTVYTCSYYHDFQFKQHKEDVLKDVLQAYVLASIKCCRFIWDEMKSGNVYEEEDFMTNLFGLSLFDEYPDSMAVEELETVIFRMQKVIEDSKNDHDQEDRLVLSAIHDRLYVRKKYLLALYYLSHTHCSHLGEAKEILQNVLDTLQSKKESIEVGNTKGEQVEGAFDPNINRKLTAHAPPRPITLPSNEEAYEHYRQLVRRLLTICDAPKYTSVTSLMNFCKTFASTRPYPDAFSRSKLNSILYHDSRLFGTRSVTNFVACAINELVHPPTWMLFPAQSTPPKHIQSANLEIAQSALAQFLERAALPFIDLLKLQCHNRSRQRRTLAKLIAEWEMLQDEAAGVDELFHELQNQEFAPYYLSCWAYYVKLECMETVLLLGFELELYGLHEYTMIYLYLRYILDAREFLLSRIEKTMYLTANDDAKEVSVFETLHARQQLLVFRKALTSGLYKLLVLLQSKTHQLAVPKLRFDDEETRFRHRFKSFLVLNSPPPPSFAAFKDTLEAQNVSVLELMQGAEADLKAAKEALKVTRDMSPQVTSTEMCHKEFEQELSQLAKTCVANSIVLLRLKDAKNHKQKATVNFGYHPWWPVVELQNS